MAGLLDAHCREPGRYGRRELSFESWNAQYLGLGKAEAGITPAQATDNLNSIRARPGAGVSGR